MTGPDTSVDPVGPFMAALRTARPDYHRTLRTTTRLVVKLNTAARRGWTTDALVAEAVRDHHGAINTAAVIQHRIDWAADHDPPTSHAKAGVAPFCTNECRENQGLLLDETTRLPIGKCPCRTQPANATPEAP